MTSFAVVGAGIVGAAVAREITQRFPASSVSVYEKADNAAAHQSGHNSGVVHAGLYYEPGSLKARLCRRGVGLIRDYALARNLPYEECGKLVVALREDEEPRLEVLFANAVANEVSDVELVDAERIRQIEPNAVGRLALHSPHTAIIDYAAVTRALLDDVRDAGGTVLYGAEVLDMANNDRGCAIETGVGSRTHDVVVVCAGLQSDRIAEMAGAARYPRIVPFFGQYSKLESAYANILNGLVYPVPDPAYPFLGVHLTKRVDGEMLVGPNAFLSFGRENYSGWKLGLRDSLDVARDRAFWKFASGNTKAAAREIGAVISRKKFLAGAAEYVPLLAEARSTPVTRGIRAQAMDENGGLLDDFVVEHVGRTTLIRNAPSPGATSALAIAEHIVGIVSTEHGLGQD
jgi:L-2-hydroxyglutarate oxidase